MGNEKFEILCKTLVLDYINKKLKPHNMFKYHNITIDDIYVVWLCRTLQNNKALVSTTIEDDMYYEVTYNGDKNETYLDAYKKIENILCEGE